MTMRAYSVDYPYRYRPAPIRAAFTLCHGDVYFRLRCTQRIGRNWAAINSCKDGIVWITDLIDTSSQRRAIQIPIAVRSAPTPSQHPAVSSLEAYPTPAR